MSALDAIFEAVRAACKPAVWSRGVELRRGNAVTAESRDDDEWILDVAVPGGLASRRVHLFLDDLEWDCDCGSRLAACEHVAAAALATRDDAIASSAKAEGRVVYRLAKEPAGLSIERLLETGRADPVRLDATLAAVARGRVPGVRARPTQADLAVELSLGRRNPQTVGTAAIPKLFGRLQRLDTIEYDGRRVRVSADPIGPRVVLEDHGDDFRLRLETSEPFEERFANGVVRQGDVFRPWVEPALTAREREAFVRGETVSASDVGDLVDRRLPDLEARAVVEVRTERLPGTTHERPRIAWDIRESDGGLEVLPTLVYGDPPRARIDGDRLVHLSGGIPRRDPAAERVLRERLRQTVKMAPGGREFFDGAEAVAFRTRWHAFEEASGAGSPSPPAELERYVERPPIVVRAGRDGLPEFAVARADGGASLADPSAVVDAWRRGDGLVPLLDGGWSSIPDDWLERFGDALADLLSAREAGGGAERALATETLELVDSVGGVAPEALRARVRSWLAGPPPVESPQDAAFTLRGYQETGVRWLAARRAEGFGTLLADDMGLGKTLQALATAPSGTLVVAPTSVLPNWISEIEKFRPGVTVNRYHGPDRELRDDADLTLTSYAILRLDREALTSRTWSWVVLDEAQAIKNPDSHTARAACALPADARTALTGTPVENRLDELWSLFRFLIPGLLGSREDFDERFARPIAAGDASSAERLRSRLRPFLLRRLKEDVAPELPPRTEIVQRFDLDPEERERYDAIRVATRDEVMAGLDAGGGVLQALEALLRLRQTACHPALVPGFEAERSTKVDLLLSMLETVEAEGRKALVFSQWTSLLDLVQRAIDDRGWPTARLDGSTRDRGGVVDRFQAADGPPFLLVSLKAGGTGLNLTAADHVFILDPWWNPAAERQAADRTHRIGQDKPVMVYRLVARDTVEERVLDLQERKRALMHAAVGDGPVDAVPTREELIELLR